MKIVRLSMGVQDPALSRFPTTQCYYCVRSKTLRTNYNTKDGKRSMQSGRWQTDSTERELELLWRGISRLSGASQMTSTLIRPDMEGE